MLTTIDTFLSHADEDKTIARKLADALAKYDFEVFVAHDDIEIGEEWENTLKERIEKCELFIALLSKNFHKAHFTDHEIGIASAMNKQIFPLRIDETMPYGFMSKYQAKKISQEIIPLEVSKLAERLMTFTNSGKQLIDNLIEKFAYSRSFNEANSRSSDLFDFSTFSKSQINAIADAFLSNMQIRSAWTARPSTLEFLAKNWKDVDQKYKEQLQRYFERD